VYDKLLKPAQSLQITLYLGISLPNCTDPSNAQLNLQPSIVSPVKYRQYSTVYYSKVQYSAVDYSTVHCSKVQYSAVDYSTVQYTAVKYSTVQ
jgi:hypothetical protein